MSTAPSSAVFFDVTEVGRADTRACLKESLRTSGYASKEITDFWKRFLGQTGRQRCPTKALVMGDLSKIAGHYRDVGSHRWLSAVRRTRPYFVAVVRTKQDARCASLVHELMRHSDDRLVFCGGLDCEDEMRECLNGALAALDSESVVAVRFSRARPNTFWVEFGDGFSGYVSWRALGMEEVIEDLEAESAMVGRRCKTIELTTKDGELFEIDSVAVRAVLDRDVERALSEEARLSDEAVGERVRAARRSARLTQTELGTRAGLDQAVISRLEQGKHEPRVDTLRRVAAALEMRLPELLSFAN